MIKICQFCNEETICTALHSPDFEDQTRKCKVCQVLYEIKFDKIIRLYIILENKLMWCFDYHYNKSDLFLNKGKWKPLEIVHSFPFIPPNVNPNNAQNKIKQYLAFL